VIPAIILAAGKSNAWGRPSAPAAHDGDTFLTRIIARFATGVGDIVVVLGHEPEVIVAVLDERECRRESSSTRTTRRGSFPVDDCRIGRDRSSGRRRCACGAGRHAARPRPLPVRALLDRYRQTRAEVVRPARGSRHGHPTVIDRSLFDVLRNAGPVRGPG